MSGSYKAMNLGETHQTVHLKWVHFIICKLYIMQLKWMTFHYLLCLCYDEINTNNE